MLQSLHMEHVGPSDELKIDFSQRLNFITGDNGLGKTFLLDIAWWALTRTWGRVPVAPHRELGLKPFIKYQYTTSKGKPHTYKSRFDKENQVWPGKQGRPPIPGMVIYAQVDGGFSVWDPARNYWKPESSNTVERPSSFVFSPDQVWNGLAGEKSRKLCGGLIDDWAAWQRDDGDAFSQLTRVLESLSPSKDEVLRPGKLTRISIDDVTDHPTLKMPYDDMEVALIHASAGMRRIVSLAYLLVWTWQEHLRASEFLGRKPVREIVFLIDEIEAHLHPQWQRRIIPALLSVMTALTGTLDVKTQVITATHSPLVLVSTEALFDVDQDAIWDFDLVDRKVSLVKTPWKRYGDANNWLTSKVFDLKEPRSPEAEEAIMKAMAILVQTNPDRDEAERIDGLLKSALGESDRFWIRWSEFLDSLKGQS